MELIVRDLAKQYKNKRAVDGVSLRLTEGINGLLGANGAGKTRAVSKRERGLGAETHEIVL